MLTVGSVAPTFDGSALSGAAAVDLEWNQLQDDNILVLLFDSADDDDACNDFRSLALASRHFARLDAKVAVVCRGDEFEVRTLLDRAFGDADWDNERISFIVDSDHTIADLYEMITADGEPLWGHYIVDSFGLVRQFGQSSVGTGIGVDELIRCVEAIAQPVTDWPC